MSQQHNNTNRDLEIAESLGEIKESLKSLSKLQDDVDSLKKWRWITFGIVSAHAAGELGLAPLLKKIALIFGGAEG